MDKLHILPTRSTPEIHLDPESGILLIQGRSLSQNTSFFFDLIFSWVREYFQFPQKQTVLELKLDYFNSTSSKKIVDLLMLVKDRATPQHTVVVKWFYQEEDEDLLGMGKEIEEFMSIPFEFIPYK